MIVALALASPNLALAASPGGVGTQPSTPPAETAPPESGCTAETSGVSSTEACAAVKKARLIGGEAIAPVGAPASVRAVITAANSIRTKPYIWGGGHRSWYSPGYDCSGAVSFALHGAKLLSTPLDSGSLERWGSGGAGRWITVYANKGHTYAVIAGLRWDTAGNTSGTGPRWHKQTAAAAPGRYAVRHPAGY
jgi:cell wall-associated NlpC family hydrolase